jgi:hypothetical protein
MRLAYELTRRYEISVFRKGTRYIRFDVFTAVTVKNAVFRDTKIMLVPQKEHITSPLQIPAG